MGRVWFFTLTLYLRFLHGCQFLCMLGEECAIFFDNFELVFFYYLISQKLVGSAIT